MYGALRAWLLRRLRSHDSRGHELGQTATWCGSEEPHSAFTGRHVPQTGRADAANPEGSSGFTEAIVPDGGTLAGPCQTERETASELHIPGSETR